MIKNRYMSGQPRAAAPRDYGVSLTIPDQAFDAKTLIKYSQSTSDMSSIATDHYLEDVENPHLHLRPFYEDELDLRADLAKQAAALEKTQREIAAAAVAQEQVNKAAAENGQVAAQAVAEKQ